MKEEVWYNFYDVRDNRGERKTCYREYHDGFWRITFVGEDGYQEYCLELYPDDAKCLGYALEEQSWGPPLD